MFYYGSLSDERIISYNQYLVLEFQDSTSNKTNPEDRIRIKEIPAEEFYPKDYDGKIRYTKYLTIPSQLFKYEKGSVRFSLYEEYQSSNGQIQTGSGNGIPVYYKKENNKIIISNKSF